MIENVWDVASGQQLNGGEWPRMGEAAGSLDKGTPSDHEDRDDLVRAVMIL